MIKGRIYADERVGNKGRRFGSAADWTAAYEITPDGLAVPLLLTDDQLAVARQRAEANPEDCPPSAPDAGDERAFVAMVVGGAFGIGLAIGLAL